MCGPQLIVKNTFLCTPDVAGDMSPPADGAMRRRAQTSDVAWLHAQSASSSDEEYFVEEWPVARAASAPESRDIVTDIRTTSAEQDPRAERLLLQLREADTLPTEEAVSVAREVMEEIRDDLVDLALSASYGSVLSGLIDRLQPVDVAVMAGELLGHGLRLSSNIHGHAILCRLIERVPQDVRIVRLAEEALSGDAARLCCHKFGYLVAISILSSGLEQQRRQIVTALSQHVQRFARHRFASKVLEHALALRHPGECDRLVEEFLRVPGALAKLACHCFGTHVVRGLLDMPCVGRDVLAHLMLSENRLRKDRYASQLLPETGRCEPTMVLMQIVPVLVVGA